MVPNVPPVSIPPMTGNVFTITADCDDGVRNGDEQQLDCGGSCPPCTPDSFLPDVMTENLDTIITIGGGSPCPTCTITLHATANCGSPIPLSMPCPSCLSKPIPGTVSIFNSCGDGVSNGQEQQTDCGGADCSPCIANVEPLPSVAFGTRIEVMLYGETDSRTVYFISSDDQCSYALSGTAEVVYSHPV
eukprot:gene6496-1157_t